MTDCKQQRCMVEAPCNFGAAFLHVELGQNECKELRRNIFIHYAILIEVNTVLQTVLYRSRTMTSDLWYGTASLAKKYLRVGVSLIILLFTIEVK